MLTIRTILILVAVLVADGAIAQSPKEPLKHPNQSKEAPKPDKRGTEQALTSPQLLGHRSSSFTPTR